MLPCLNRGYPNAISQDFLRFDIYRMVGAYQVSVLLKGKFQYKLIADNASHLQKIAECPSVRFIPSFFLLSAQAACSVLFLQMTDHLKKWL
jgi:hypothetical protein